MAPCTLLFDIGNTTITMGLAREELEAIEVFNLPTRSGETGDSLGLALLGLCGNAGIPANEVEACVACSVAPFVDPLLRHACRRFFGVEVCFVPENLPVPLENRYERSFEVGADRLVTAFAARALCDTAAVIVIDFGTATTFECVLDNAYLGGLICPGVLSSASALATRTAKLPQIRLELESTEMRIGQNTSTSLNQGLIFGFASMTEGLCARLRTMLADMGATGSVPVVATGGFAPVIAQVCGCFDHLRPDLLLEGLRCLWKGAGRSRA